MRYLTILLLLIGLSADVSAHTDKDRRVRVRLETTAGTMVMALFDETPRHRDNFLKLVRQGYYDGLLFHRVIADFMVQTGDPDSRAAKPGQRLGDGGPGYTLPLETALPYRYHYRGAVAAAREPDEVNPERRSSGSQFYIVWGKTFNERTFPPMRDYVSEMTGGEVEFTPEMVRTYMNEGGTPHLDGQYTVFGEIIEGMKVVKAIQKAETDADDRPVEDIRIIKAEVVE
ncbi:MAG: peptidylprolyl isomerase [Bacteroidaceae bacterium]|nr:peptidylprolyl isomerase [Bacteroidaceae bacterium]